MCTPRRSRRVEDIVKRREGSRSDALQLDSVRAKQLRSLERSSS
jgi:hypothetical protein